MVKEENVNYYNANKYVLAFLAEHASPELVEQWKSKSNLHKFKNHMRSVKNNLPRRPMSEYIYFCREERPKIQEEMKKKNNTEVVNIHEVTCELGRRWQRFKEFPDADMKQRLKELADIDSRRYHEEKVVSVPQQNNKKHLRSKYLFFCREQRIADPKITMKVLGEKWIEQKDDKALTRRYEKAKKQLEVEAGVEAETATVIYQTEQTEPPPDQDTGDVNVVDEKKKQPKQGVSKTKVKKQSSQQGINSKEHEEYKESLENPLEQSKHPV
jgi:hypothetical protein